MTTGINIHVDISSQPSHFNNRTYAKDSRKTRQRTRDWKLFTKILDEIQNNDIPLSNKTDVDNEVLETENDIQVSVNRNSGIVQLKIRNLPLYVKG